MSNPFLNASMEENTLDANDNNPLLKAEDPAKTAEEDGQKIADDFEYVDSEAVEGENQKPDEAIITGKESELVGELNNIVEVTAKESDTISALASVAQEMYHVIQTRGKLEPIEAMLIGNMVQSFESVMPSLADVERKMPSMEDFKVVGMQYTQTQVSLEGVLDRLNTGLNNLGLNIERLFKNGIGLARSMTPIIDSQIANAQKLRSNLNGAHRDAGQKEITGDFVKRLVIEGRAPDAGSVVKSAAYLNQSMAELLSSKVVDGSLQYVKASQNVLREGMNNSPIKNPSALLAFAVKLLIPNNNLGAALSGAHDDYLKDVVGKQIKLDVSIAPELAKLFPSIAKIRDVSVDEDFMEGYRSLSLFGNKAIALTQYKKNVALDARPHDTPEIRLDSFGKGYSKTIQALNASQQADVLDSALGILQTSRAYFKEYAARNKACMGAWQQAYKQVLELHKTKSGFSQSVTRNACIELLNFYTRMYWQGIFQHQSKIAIYGRRTTAALIELVEKSSANAQGGSPKASQESIVLTTEQKNPFM